LVNPKKKGESGLNVRDGNWGEKDGRNSQGEGGSCHLRNSFWDCKIANLIGKKELFWSVGSFVIEGLPARREGGFEFCVDVVVIRPGKRNRKREKYSQEKRKGKGGDPITIPARACCSAAGRKQRPNTHGRKRGNQTEEKGFPP